MTVDVSKLREGDVVLVRVTVAELLPTSLAIQVKDADDDYATIPHDWIVSVEPRPLKVGDRVRRQDFLPDFKVIAVDGGMAWIRADTPRGAEYLIDLSELSPA